MQLNTLGTAAIINKKNIEIMRYELVFVISFSGTLSLKIKKNIGLS